MTLTKIDRNRYSSVLFWVAAILAITAGSWTWHKHTEYQREQSAIKLRNAKVDEKLAMRGVWMAATSAIQQQHVQEIAALEQRLEEAIRERTIDRIYRSEFQAWVQKLREAHPELCLPKLPERKEVVEKPIKTS